MHDFGLPELPGARPGSGEPIMHDFGLPELPGARPGSGEPKMHDFVLPERPGARPGSSEPNMHDFGLPELPGVRPVSGEPKMMIMVNQSCRDPGLAPLNEKCTFLPLGPSNFFRIAFFVGLVMCSSTIAILLGLEESARGRRRAPRRERWCVLALV